jgi:hypothetical protein
MSGADAVSYITVCLLITSMRIRMLAPVIDEKSVCEISGFRDGDNEDVSAI